MSNEVGSIGWVDISTDDAVALKDFYAAILGVQTEPTVMGDYSDFTLLTPSSGAPIAGVCHARGSNASMPQGWLVYFTVSDLDASIADCVRLGGRQLVDPRQYGSGRFCVIEDPDGNPAALYQA